MAESVTEPDALSDAELWRAYVDDDAKGAGDAKAAGEAFILIYARYRDRMRSTMEAAGLSANEAEHRVGSVFMRALDTQDTRDMPLASRLEEAARAIAADPDWRAAP